MKLTATTQKRILDCLAAGNDRKTAAAYAGVAAHTMYEWMARGQERNPGTERRTTPRYAAFATAVENAEVRCKVELLARIKQAAGGTNDMRPQWQAAAWMLERKWPEEFARRDRLDLGGQKDNPIRVKDETPYDFDAMRATFRRLVNGNGTGGNGADCDGAQESVHSAPPMVKAGPFPDRLG